MTVKVMFHSFTMGDVDDVDIYAALPISHWQDSEHGRWVMENATNLTYHTMPDATTFGYRVSIRGDLEEKKATEYFLRWK